MPARLLIGLVENGIMSASPPPTDLILARIFRFRRVRTARATGYYTQLYTGTSTDRAKIERNKRK